MGWRRSGALILALAVATAASAEEGPPSAWVLQDQDAREAGVLVEISGQSIDATMPVEVAQDQELAIVDGPRLRRAWLQGELLYLVQGRRGKLRATRPGIDVAVDIVAVRTDEDTAHDLAAELGAEVEQDRNRWLLHGDQVLFELAYLAIPDADLDIVPVPLRSSSSSRQKRRFAKVRPKIERSNRRKNRRTRIEAPAKEQAPVEGATEVTGWSLPLEGHPVPSTRTRARPELVGWYCTEAKCVVLGVDGLAHTCSESGCDEAGEWFPQGEGLRVGEKTYTWSNGKLVVTQQELNDVE